MLGAWCAGRSRWGRCRSRYLDSISVTVWFRSRLRTRLRGWLRCGLRSGVFNSINVTMRLRVMLGSWLGSRWLWSINMPIIGMVPSLFDIYVSWTFPEFQLTLSDVLDIESSGIGVIRKIGVASEATIHYSFSRDSTELCCSVQWWDGELARCVRLDVVLQHASVDVNVVASKASNVFFEFPSPLETVSDCDCMSLLCTDAIFVEFKVDTSMIVADLLAVVADFKLSGCRVAEPVDNGRERSNEKNMREQHDD
jgi:hypothetical protein